MVKSTDKFINLAQASRIVVDLDDVVNELICKGKLDAAEYVASCRDELISELTK